MTYEPIQSLEVENYGCIRNATFALTPLHALIGPNDSGKSTALRAVRTAAQFGAGTFVPDDRHVWRPFDPMLDVASSRAESTKIAVCCRDGTAYAVRTTSEGVRESVLAGSVVKKEEARRDWREPGLLRTRVPPPQAHRVERADALKVELAVEPLRSRLTIATMVRFDPDYLRAPAPLIPERDGIAFTDERGTGLASVFDAIMNREAEAFARIQDGVRSIFPTVSKLGLLNVSNSQKEIAVTLTDGARVGAKAMSEGLLY